MSSRRSISCDDEPGPSKRQKVYRACLACVNSKTRCEDVSPRDGCLRCRSKSKSCSLVMPEMRPQPPQTHTVDASARNRLTEMEAEWQALRQRLDRLERDISTRPTLTTIPSGSISHVNTPSSSAAVRPVGIHEIYTTNHWESVAMTERVFNVASDLGYPDPVSRGIVSAEEMEMAFHL